MQLVRSQVVNLEKELKIIPQEVIKMGIPVA
jgi:hypothetical protein